MISGWTGSRSSADSSVRAADNDDGIYTQLLQQASDLNNELSRENSELRREVAELRQRQVQRIKRDADGSRTAKVRRLMPRAMSNIKSVLRDIPECAEGLPLLLEEAANRVFASMAELQESNAAMASGEETAALIAEKVALKEFCIHQQERLLELELAKEKLHANSSSFLQLSALRLTSALQGISEAAPRHSPKHGPQPEVIVQLPMVNIGDECEVVGRRGAILRELEDLQSPLVATVAQGGHVRIVQVAASESRRAMVEVIDSPEVDTAPAGGCAVPGSIGWLSVSTKDGKALIRPRAKSQAEVASEAAPSTQLNTKTEEAETSAAAKPLETKQTEQTGLEPEGPPCKAEPLEEPPKAEPSKESENELTGDVKASEAEPTLLAEVASATATDDPQEPSAAFSEKSETRDQPAEAPPVEVPTAKAHSEVPHAEVPPGEAHSELPHAEVPPAEAHSEVPHAEVPPAEAHSEVPPAEAQSEAPQAEVPPAEAHSEAPHAEVPPAEAHSEVPHAEVPPAEAHSEVPQAEVPPAEAHSEVPHAEVPPAEAHSEVPHAEVPPAEAHSEVPHAEVPPVEAHSEVPHAEVPPGEAHSEVPHAEVPPAEAHSEVPHAEVPPDEAHSEVPHAEVPPAEAHSEVPHAEVSSVTSASLEGSKGSLRASNEAWVELRRERRQRERQVKAMQAQVESARKQVEQLDEMKAKLREYRSAALEARQRGQEFFEGLRMASEELRVIDRPRAQVGTAEDADELKEIDEEGPVEEPPQAVEEQTQPEDAFVDEEAVEWRRLLSERETTARELASTLRQVEEMEKEVEDHRIELDIAQRRRERERSSLLTALRELGYWREGSPSGKRDDEAVLDEGETSDGPSSRTAWASESSPSGHPSGQKGRDEDKERQYLQRISELEESVLKLQEQIDTVQARIALLNQQAVTRQQALRYASSLPAVGGLAEAITARVTSRPDVDGLTEMLGRLFVENFDLRRKLRAASAGSENEAFQSESSIPAQVALPLDLSRFAVPEGADSDDESLVPAPSLGAVTIVNECKPSTSLRLPSPEPADPETAKSSGRPRDVAKSPRSLLLALDFKALPVAE